MNDMFGSKRQNEKLSQKELIEKAKKATADISCNTKLTDKQLDRLAYWYYWPFSKEYKEVTPMSKERFHFSKDMTEGEKLVWTAVFADVALREARLEHGPSLSFQTADLAVRYACDAIKTLRDMRDMLPEAQRDVDFECCYVEKQAED